MKNFYIVVGFNEKSNYKIYQKFAEEILNKNYNVRFVDLNFKINLSKQIFKINKNDILFGFSIGAIFVLLLSQKYKCKKIFLASMTPLSYFLDKKEIEIFKELEKIFNKDFVLDIKNNLKNKSLCENIYNFYGDREDMDKEKNITIKNTGHRMNTNYIKEILKYL